MPITHFLANATLAHQLGKTAYTMPTVHVGLSSSTPTVLGGNVTEPSTGSYARVTTSGSTWGTPTLGSVSNVLDIAFPTASSSWLSGAQLTYVVLFDAATAGNCLGYVALASSKNVLTGNTLVLSAGDVTVLIN